MSANDFRLGVGYFCVDGSVRVLQRAYTDETYSSFVPTVGGENHDGVHYTSSGYAFDSRTGRRLPALNLTGAHAPHEPVDWFGP